MELKWNIFLLYWKKCNNFLWPIHQYTWIGITTLVRTQRIEMYWFYCDSHRKNTVFCANTPTDDGEQRLRQFSRCLPTQEKRHHFEKKKKLHRMCASYYFCFISERPTFNIFEISQSLLLIFRFSVFRFFCSICVFYLCFDFQMENENREKRRNQKIKTICHSPSTDQEKWTKRKNWIIFDDKRKNENTKQWTFQIISRLV